ncbi:hypothetical protein GORDON_60 [Arthrobacter phage Gordon]|uniref:Uncharacterized protein n=1 Tax=Arthrobacter phage Gordon TaxID=1772298 RepID=A0A0U4JR52_9CAUD|nr:hypothetical protein FDH69_gp60 [Arthrobacter phage Gordon]ALY09035.1 hypothetical protein GORDON_60 [Arthrobacter phage Gordon]
MAASKKSKKSGSPVPKSKRELLAKKVFNRLQEGVALTAEFQAHIVPHGECLITLQQWTYLRGSILSDMALLAELEDKPSPLDIIIKSEQERALIES